MNTGWFENDVISFNLIDSRCFGFEVYRYDENTMSSMGMYINDMSFGWYDEFNMDGSVYDKMSGFYLNEIKVKL